MLTFVGLGLGLTPAMSVVLILAYKSVPLLYVNLIASAVYVALVPYVAICLAVVYFDLESRTSRLEPRL